LCLLVSTTTLAQFDEAPPKFDSYSDFGGVGLLQMPTARFSPEGEFAFATTKVYPYTQCPHCSAFALVGRCLALYNG
jgi:hypothetical protein